MDTILGPEMRSTGEVMGISSTFGLAFAKAQLAAGQRLPLKGTVFISVNDHDKRLVAPLVREIAAAGLKITGHARDCRPLLKRAGIEVEAIYKVNEGRPNIVDLIKTGKVNLVINTPLGRESFYDEKSIRRAAIRYNVPCITTLARGDRGRARNPRNERTHRRSSRSSGSAQPQAGSNGLPGRSFIAAGERWTGQWPAF